MKDFFVVLGGMGTLATCNFLNDMNKIYKPDSDQEYLNYLVFNHAAIPDRTKYILGESDENPLDYLACDIKQADQLGPDFYVITCNTAHFFYNELAKLTKVPIINMIELLEDSLKSLDKPSKISLFATEGTIKSGLFEKVVRDSGHTLLENPRNIQDKINSCLYEDVKQRGVADFDKYHQTLNDLYDNGADLVVLACTEASYINSLDTDRSYPLLDTEKLLVKESIRRALSFRNSK